MRRACQARPQGPTAAEPTWHLARRLLLLLLSLLPLFLWRGTGLPASLPSPACLLPLASCLLTAAGLLEAAANRPRRLDERAGRPDGGCTSSRRWRPNRTGFSRPVTMGWGRTRTRSPLASRLFTLLCRSSLCCSAALHSPSALQASIPDSCRSHPISSPSAPGVRGWGGGLVRARMQVRRDPWPAIAPAPCFH